MQDFNQWLRARNRHPTKILKDMRGVVSKPLSSIWNIQCVENSIRDKDGHAGAVLMDLSKAFDTIRHKFFAIETEERTGDKSNHA